MRRIVTRGIQVIVDLFILSLAYGIAFLLRFEFDPSFDFYKLLNRKAGKVTLLSILDPATKKSWEEVVKPISIGAENQLLYKRWVETRNIMDTRHITT